MELEIKDRIRKDGGHEDTDAGHAIFDFEEPGREEHDLVVHFEDETEGDFQLTL